MVYAFSRDGAVPLSRFWHKVNGREVPLNAVWLSALVAFIFALPVRWHPFLLHDLSISLCAWWPPLPWFMSQKDRRNVCMPNCWFLQKSECSWGAGPGFAVIGEFGGISSHGINSHNWFVHFVCTANILPHHNSKEDIRTRAFQFREVQPFHWMGRSRMGGGHHCPLLLTCCLSGKQIIIELHPCCSWGSLCAGSALLGTECPAVVQRATSQSGWISSWPKTSTIVAPFPWPNVHGRIFCVFQNHSIGQLGDWFILQEQGYYPGMLPYRMNIGKTLSW